MVGKRSCCENSGFRFPIANITINLAPADKRKEGSAFDVALLMGLLRSGGYIHSDVMFADKCFVGELSLSGALRGVRGVLSMCVAARNAGFKEFYAPAQNAAEAAAVEGIEVYAVENMRQLVNHLNGTESIYPVSYDRSAFFADAAEYGRNQP